MDIRRFSRRQFVAATAALTATLALPSRADDRGDHGDRGVSFLHGVASGDPLQTRVILWTRVTPTDLNAELEVDWYIARDPGMRRVVSHGNSKTDIRRDFTVKVDADDLEPGRTYYYQFAVRGVRSPVGRTKTLPEGRVDHTRLAFVSCSNLPAGLFNVYGLVAERLDIDAVLHLGDYIYEYANATYGDGTALGRVPTPNQEIITLVDYRLRHAQYKQDADLKAAHQQHPFICVWDDHESANDSWKDGAQNHNPELGEGEWSVRKRAAIRAYFEWMPIREHGVQVNTRIFRDFRFGNLADLLMLDTRLYGRDKQSAVKPINASVGYPANDAIINDPARTLLGFDQEAWLDAKLVASKQRGTTWRLLGQQVMMAQLSVSGGQTLFNLDQWDGYRPARERLYSTLRNNNVDNVVVMTGDIHTSWANELTSNPWDRTGAYNPATGKGVVGVEFVTPAVSSPGFTNPVEAAQTAYYLRTVSPHMKYIELYKRGYGLLDITRERVQGEIWHVATVDAPSRTQVMASAFVNEAGNNWLQPATTPSTAKVATDPAA